MKFPSLQFYPGDWLRDTVSGCSLAAQGLWLRMMFLMHDSERYGYLCQNGQPIPPAQIARRCGCTPDEYVALLAELESAGVPSRSQDDIIYSRRMVRDAADRAKATARKRKQRGHADVPPSVTPESHNGRAPSSSSPSSSSSVTGKPVTSGRAREAEKFPPPPDAVEAVKIFFDITAEPISIPTQTRIEAEVSDVALWRRVVKRLSSNGTPARNIGTFLDVYHEWTGKAANSAAATDVKLV